MTRRENNRTGMQLEGQEHHAKDLRQEGFCIGVHERKKVRDGEDDGKGGAHLQTLVSRI